MKLYLKTTIALFLLGITVAYSGNGFTGHKSLNPLNTSDFSGTMEKVFRGMSVGGGVGGSLAYGDLTPYKYFPKTSTWKTYMNGGFSLYLERDIKWGLGARFQYQNGNMKGERRTDVNQVGPLIGFKTNYETYSLLIRYDLTETLFKPNEYRRFYLRGYIGGGLMLYRSYSYYKDLNAWIYRSYGYVEDRNSNGQYYLASKDKKRKVFTLPLAARFGYRINYKTDLFFETTVYNTYVDNLDGFDRSEFSANDKALYTGVGICFNFGRTEDDLPKKPKNSGDNADGGHEFNSEMHDQDIAKRRGILRRYFNKDRSKEELEMKLRQYDTELKKFEGDYLKEK